MTPNDCRTHDPTRRFAGIELGLSICKRLIEMWGGRITMQSEPCEGATVILRSRSPIVCARYDLPTLRGQAVLLAIGEDGQAALPTRPVHPNDDATIRSQLPAIQILVAEDHPVNRELMRQQLILLNYQCTLCCDGREALQALQHGAFDLVLTDCHMPNMDGFALTRCIRASTDMRVRTLPVIGVTATTIGEDHQRCFDVGMNACVLKPTTLASIQQAIATALAEPHGVTTTVVLSSRARKGQNETADMAFDASRICRDDLLAALGPAPYPKPLLNACQASLRADRDALVEHLDAPSNDELSTWCHRTGGALALFQLPYLDQRFDAFSAVVKGGDAAAIQAAGSVMLSIFAHLIDLLGTPARP